MGNCNVRALFAISCLSSLAAEVCFLSVLFLVPNVHQNKEAANQSETKFCWSNFEGKDSVKEAKCPYFALFLAAIVNGMHLLFTASFLLARLLGSKECSLKRIPVCKLILRFGSFTAGAFTCVLVLTFIGLIIGFNSKRKWTGEIVDRNGPYAYFIVTCVGFAFALLSLLTAALVAFRRRQNQNDDFEDSVYRSYSEHSTEDFFDIN